jgi:hypothetical protein
MKTLLERAKALLIAQANDLYDIRKDDLDLDALSFRNHYSNLGELVFQIECYESSEILLKILKMIIFKNWDISEQMKICLKLF